MVEMRERLEKLPCTFDKDYAWSNFKTLDGEFVSVSEERFLEEAYKVIDEIGFCRVFEDPDEGCLWISGVGEDPEKRYIYHI